MLKQQINLYLPEFRKKRDILSVAFMSKGLAALLAILVLLSGLEYWNTRQLDNRLFAVQTERDEAVMRVNALLDDFGVQSTDPALTQRIRNLESELAEKRRLLQFMEGRELGNTQGFSAHFVDMARYHVNGLRLSEIRLTRGASVISLQGEVRSADLVPLYLQNLRQSQAFAGKTFETLRLETASTGNLQFSVVSNSNQ